MASRSVHICISWTYRRSLRLPGPSDRSWVRLFFIIESTGVCRLRQIWNAILILLLGFQTRSNLHHLYRPQKRCMRLSFATISPQCYTRLGSHVQPHSRFLWHRTKGVRYRADTRQPHSLQIPAIPARAYSISCDYSTYPCRTSLSHKKHN